MKFLIFGFMTFAFIFFASCAENRIQEINESTIITTLEQTTASGQTTERQTYPTRSWHDENFVFDGFSVGRFRPMFYSLPYHITNLVDANAFIDWAPFRSDEEYHYEAIAVSFIRYFDVSREEFERANEEWRNFLIGRGMIPNGSSNAEIYDVDLIFTFDNERINEFFRWENSNFGHEVGLDCCICDQCT